MKPYKISQLSFGSDHCLVKSVRDSVTGKYTHGVLTPAGDVVGIYDFVLILRDSLAEITAEHEKLLNSKTD